MKSSTRHLGGARRDGVSINFTVAVLAPSFPPAFRGGGPARTLQALVRGAPSGIRLMVFAPDKDAGETTRLPVVRNKWSKQGAHDAYFLSADQPLQVLRAIAALRREKPNVVYLNSLFNTVFSVLPLMLWGFGFFGSAQLLLAPRGELDRGALALKHRKKRLYLRLLLLLPFHRRIVWHASSAMERSAVIRAFGQDANVLVRENDTLLPPDPISPTRSGDRASLVFLSRISRKKGLDIALEALQNVKAEVDFDIYGPHEDASYLSECRELITRLPATVHARILGPIGPQGVRETLANYDAMVFPTHGENFGHVVAEALSGSCPVLCSSHTLWSPILAAGGGVVVEGDNAVAWSAVIEEWAARSPVARDQARTSAGEAYRRWFAEDKGAHVLEMLRGFALRKTVSKGAR